jgi:hypothetical protein
VAKNRRKISAAQRDKSNIETAKILKKAGIISKQAKLHSGSYISPGVLRKVREHQAAANLGYKAVKVSKATAQAAKERGYQVIAGNKIIGPSSQQFRNRLKKGELTGVRPVKGGFMEEVTLPYNVYDMRSLMEQLGEGIDTLKMPDEQFAFKYHGNESYRAFMNSKQLLDYLQHYKSFVGVESVKPEDLQEEFEAFTIFRLHPNAVDLNIRGPRRRREDRKRERKEAIERGEYVGVPRKRKSRADKAAAMHPNAAKRYLAKMAKKDQARREKIAADPKAAAEYKRKARARAQKSRDNKKGK